MPFYYHKKKKVMHYPSGLASFNLYDPINIWHFWDKRSLSCSPTVGQAAKPSMSIDLASFFKKLIIIIALYRVSYLVTYKYLTESVTDEANKCLFYCCFLGLPGSLIKISLIKYSLFIWIPQVLCCWFKSYLRLPDLHLVSIMRQLECPARGEQRSAAQEPFTNCVPPFRNCVK